MKKYAQGFSRREFIGTLAGAAAGLGAASAGQAKPAEDFPKSDKVLRIGIIGGRFGLSFQWHEHPNCKVSAVCDLLADRRQALQETYRCSTAYTDWRELVRDPQVDAVGVFTPAPLHVEMAV